MIDLPIRAETEDETRARLAAEREAKEDAAVERARQLNSEDLAPSEHDLLSLEMADRAMRGRSQKLRAVAARHKTKVEAAALDRRMGETQALAAARGEDVTQLPSGALRANDRDLLAKMMRTGKFTADQFDAAVDCRSMYEARSAGLGAMEYTDAGRSAVDTDVTVWNGVQRGKKNQRLGEIERAIALHCRDEPAALQMFRAVVGNGIAVSAFGKGSTYERHLLALTRALDVADALIRGRG